MGSNPTRDECYQQFLECFNSNEDDQPPITPKKRKRFQFCDSEKYIIDLTEEHDDYGDDLQVLLKTRFSGTAEIKKERVDEFVPYRSQNSRSPISACNGDRIENEEMDRRKDFSEKTGIQGKQAIDASSLSISGSDESVESISGNSDYDESKEPASDLENDGAGILQKDHANTFILPRNNSSKSNEASAQDPKKSTAIGHWEHWEHLEFLRGLRVHGPGRWKEIGEKIPTRTRLQVKTHAQAVLKKYHDGINIFEPLDNLKSDDKITVKDAKREGESIARKKSSERILRSAARRNGSKEDRNKSDKSNLLKKSAQPLSPVPAGESTLEKGRKQRNDPDPQKKQATSPSRKRTRGELSDDGSQRSSSPAPAGQTTLENDKKTRFSNFTLEEDAIIIDAVQNSSEQPFNKWVKLAKKLPGHNAKRIRERWINKLDPRICHLPFTDKEYLLLWESYRTFGKSWVKISARAFHFARSENQLKNAFYCAAFRKVVEEKFGHDALPMGIAEKRKPRESLRHLTTKEKEQRRRELKRAAMKRFHDRRKARIESMQEQIAALQVENERLHLSMEHETTAPAMQGTVLSCDGKI